VSDNGVEKPPDQFSRTVDKFSQTLDELERAEWEKAERLFAETGSPQAFIDLLRRRAPLNTKELRRELGIRPSSPAAKKRQRQELQNDFYLKAKAILRQKGLSTEEAGTLAAQFVGKPSIGAIKQQIKRTKRKQRKKQTKAR